MMPDRPSTSGERVDVTKMANKPWEQRSSFEQAATFMRQIVGDTIRFTIICLGMAVGFMVMGFAAIYVVYQFSKG